MDFYCVTLAGRTSQSCHGCDVETSVKCLDVSHSEFNLMKLSLWSTGNYTYKSEDERSKLIGEA